MKEFSVEKTVRERSSVRTYEQRPLSGEVKGKIQSYMNGLSNPFSVEVRFQLLEVSATAKGEKLGTYGIIKGASDYIGASVVAGDLSLEALGYSFEKLILFAADLGLGTCWLGGTFNRSAFAKVMNIKENELFPAISPIGYPAERRHLADKLVRTVAKSDQRKEFGQVFFKDDFAHPLTFAQAGEYAFPLEMVRLAPSASNKQPWRIVWTKKAYHFFKDKGYGDKLGFDIQKVDLGIAACHFHLAALERGLSGDIEVMQEMNLSAPENTQYLFSWVMK